MKNMILALALSLVSASVVLAKPSLSVQCVESVANAGFLEVRSCSYIRNKFALECVKSTFPTGGYLEINSCVYIDNQAALDCVKSQAPYFGYLEIDSCSSIR